jgi:hypothetical protein
VESLRCWDFANLVGIVNVIFCALSVLRSKTQTSPRKRGIVRMALCVVFCGAVSHPIQRSGVLQRKDGLLTIPRRPPHGRPFELLPSLLPCASILFGLFLRRSSILVCLSLRGAHFGAMDEVSVEPGEFFDDGSDAGGHFVSSCCDRISRQGLAASCDFK